ncbi:UDP-N-acetylmuramate dehydrogenase [Patescibacteria group bacterium]|nr:UDP-N-acetylmuramate dehydrogenase [Patescibacteria group bacterium]
MPNILENLKKILPDLKENEVLALYTTFKIGGPAKYFFIAKSNDDVIKAIKTAKELGINFFILGGGSNILISDKGFNGLVIKMENQKIKINNNIIFTESGLPLQKLIRKAIENSLSGLEFCIGIPGTVGGAIAGNTGSPKEWIGQKIIKVTVLNPEEEIEEIPKSQCDFSYRYSRFKYDDKSIILSGEFQLEKASPTHIQGLVNEYLEKRKNQPIKYPSAGSIFKNPEGKKAWQLIEEAGLRGKKIGSAEVSEEHANFIINTGKAKADDIVILISYIKQQVRDKLGVQMQEEIKYIGF